MESSLSRPADRTRSFARGPSIRKILLLTVVSLSVTLMVVLAIMIRVAQGDAVRMRTFGRLSQLHLALANYEYIHGRLPPRQQTDDTGNAYFNWLVPVLPQIERDDLYAALDFSNRWDSPVNLEVSRSDSLFLEWITRDGYIACPLDGDKSIWNPRTGLPVGNLSDSPGLIALIAVPIDDVHPFEPYCVTMAELRILVEKGKRSFFIRSDGKCGMVKLLDGKIRFNTL